MVKRIMGRPRQEECSPQDNALGLMHLRRLFTELCHPPRHMTQKEQEEKLYMMLPVFNRVSPGCQAHAFCDGVVLQESWGYNKSQMGKKKWLNEFLRSLIPSFQFPIRWFDVRSGQNELLLVLADKKEDCEHFVKCPSNGWYLEEG